MKGSIFLAREGRGDEGFEFLRVDSGFREKGSSICEKAMKGSSFFRGRETAPKSSNFTRFVASAPEYFCLIFGR